MIVKLFRCDGGQWRFVCNLFPQTDEAVEAIREKHPESGGWQVKVLVAEGVETE